MSYIGIFLIHFFMFAIYSGLFYTILGWLGVNQSRFIRGMFLAGILIVSDIISGVLAAFISLSSFNILISTVLAVVIFYFLVRRFLLLKAWQAIVIPIGVNIVGYIILSVLTMLALTSTTGSVS